MNEKVYHTLEYDKILLRLEELAGSEGAKALCRALVPFTEKEAVEQALAETSDAEARLIARGTLGFRGITDVRASVKRSTSGSSLSLTELVRVQQLLAMTSRAKTYGREDGEGREDALSGYFAALEPLTPLRQELDRVILSEEEIADDASPGLAKVRRQLRTISDRIHTELSALLIKNRLYLQDAVITMRDGRYCLPVKTEHKSQVGGIVHDQSGSGKALFIEPYSVVKLNNEWRELEIAEQKEIEAILAALSGQVAEQAGAIENDYRVLTRLDFIFAKARLSQGYRGVCPGLTDNLTLRFKAARHPLLDPRSVVPIDVSLGEAYDLLVVTGPNTGGKTVSLKTVGLLQLMGQAGLHIPAAPGSRLAVFGDVFADIGDEQSIEQSLSTFSSHMRNIVQIMQDAKENSLVLFDELGAGTDPTEGAALAMAILSRLHEKAIRTMATTHYSELKIFALQTEGVENASCEFNVETLRPTYRLLVGIPGKSNAFAIAGKLGLGEDIIENARSYVSGNEEAFEDVIAELDRQRVEMEQTQAQIRRLKEDTERLKEEAKRHEGSLQSQREKILQKAREEARDILQNAKDTADKAIRDLHKSGQTVTREMEEIRTGLRLELADAEKDAATSTPAAEEPRRVTVTEKKLRVGDSVHVISLGLKGTVLTLPDANGKLTVQMGILKQTVDAADVQLVAPPKSAYRGYSSGVAAKARTISPELKLIGMTVDDAMEALDKYLDDAYLAHLEKVRIIHGRGTGALKEAVANHLKRNKHIASYESAPYNEGGYGATIAVFKA